MNLWTRRHLAGGPLDGGGGGRENVANFGELVGLAGAEVVVVIAGLEGFGGGLLLSRGGRRGGARRK